MKQRSLTVAVLELLLIKYSTDFFEWVKEKLMQAFDVSLFQGNLPDIYSFVVNVQTLRTHTHFHKRQSASSLIKIGRLTQHFKMR